MAASARHIYAFSQMRHIAIDAEKLVAMPQPLTLSVDKQQNRDKHTRA